MKATLRTLLAAGILVAATAPRAFGGDLIIEPIVSLTVVPGQVVDLVFPNEFDLIHPKRVTFDGTVLPLGTSGQPTELSIKFDWFDPSDPTDPIKFSPEFLVPIPASGGAPHASFEYIIPFCPPQVRIDFAINSGDPVTIMDSVFTHQCIPEPADFGLVAAIGALVFVAPRRYRTRCAGVIFLRKRGHRERSAC